MEELIDQTTATPLSDDSCSCSPRPRTGPRWAIALCLVGCILLSCGLLYLIRSRIEEQRIAQSYLQDGVRIEAMITRDYTAYRNSSVDLVWELSYPHPDDGPELYLKVVADPDFYSLREGDAVEIVCLPDDLTDCRLPWELPKAGSVRSQFLVSR